MNTAVIDTSVALTAPCGVGLYWGGCRMHPGVERAISHSSSVISTDTSANNGVLRYRSPVSGSMHRIVDPFGAVLATCKAPANVPPEAMPTKMPSFFAISLLHLRASGLAMRKTWLMALEATASPVSLAMKSGLQPCVGCRFQLGWPDFAEPSGLRSCSTPLESIGASSGSQTTIFV